MAWLSRLLYESNQGVVTFPECPDVQFIRSDTIKCLYEILNVRQTHNIEFQAFFALMQQTGEEQGYMTVEDESQDDFVPLPVIQGFATDFIKGFSRLMREIGFKQSSTSSTLQIQQQATGQL